MSASLAIAERIRSSAEVDNASGCWVWQRYIEPLGYPRIKMGGRKGRVVYAHRVSYEAFVGPIPIGFELDHLCRNRSCVNPDHLEPVDRATNVQRSWDARKAANPGATNGNQVTSPA